MRVELYFDISCPYAYIGSTQIEALCAARGAELVWRPMLLGGVFRSIGSGEGPMASMPPAKARHNAADMHRWADVFDVPLTVPPGHPMRTVAALRAILALPESHWPALAHGFYRAYWQQGKQPGAELTLTEVVRGAGLDDDAVARALAANTDPAIKDELRRRTDEAVARGVFGAPSFFISGDDIPADQPLMFWGQDRLHMVDAVLAGWRPGSGAPPDTDPRWSGAPAKPTANANATNATIDFWYDFSSPFAYLGSTQIEALAARSGARLRWRPMLLGAIFKQVGTANVPMFAVSDNKRRWLARELELWASTWQVPFRFTSRFPMKTVTPLRLALIAGDQIAELSHALFRALWVDDRDISDDAVLADILSRLGMDAEAMLARTREPAVKQQLIDATSAAIDAGVFGAPTCVVSSESEAPMLFWGQDRLALVERAAGGWRPPLE